MAKPEKSGTVVALAAAALVALLATGALPSSASSLQSQTAGVQGEAARIEELQRETIRLIDNGQAAEAEPVAREALAATERWFGEDDHRTSISVNNLALALTGLNRLGEAERLFRRALTMRERLFGDNHPDVAQSLNNLAMVLRDLNQLDEAEPLFRRALAIREEVLPENHPSIAISLNNLASLLRSLKRLDEAERLYRRALAVRERALPEGHPSIAISLNNLALVLRSLNQLDEAERLYRRAQVIRERALPKNHPSIAIGLDNLAEVLRNLNRLDEAEQLRRRALAIREQGLPQDHPSIAIGLNNLAALLQDLDRHEEAERLLRRALAIREQALPQNHPAIATGLDNLATVLWNLKLGLEEALTFVDRAAYIYAAPENGDSVAQGPWRQRASLRVALAGELWTRDGAAAVDTLRKARRAAFLDLQWERSGGAGGAIAVAMARAQATDKEVAPLAREHDRLLDEIKILDAAFLETSSAIDVDRQVRAKQLRDLRRRADNLRKSLAAIDEELARRFPAYDELAKGAPLPVGELQRLLAPDEALLSVTSHSKYGLLFAYDRVGGVFAPLPEVTDAAIVAELTRELRCSAAGRLDDACRSAVAIQQGLTQGDFDLDRAHDLYNRLFPQEAREFLKGKRLIIAPAPELMGLPWHLLITEAPPKGWNVPGADRAKAYREAKWLFQSHPSITVLPTVASLRALRSTAPERSAADRAFLGIGDPVIGKNAAERDAPPMECGPREELVVSADAAGFGPRSAAAAPKALFAGERDAEGFALADPELVRNQPRLADTRCELTAVAGSLEERGKVDLLLDANATEERMRSLDESGELARYRILHFATHGLLGGELGLGEPGLVLTPPEKASSRDDGILTASEIATLTLAADWVVLSACNTAAGGAADAEALSGLARSFFYAGAKSLLVSSWPVYSPAAVAITTRAFDAMKNDPKIGRAEALTLAMRDVLASANSEFTAHPAYWAPFFLVGEGAR